MSELKIKDISLYNFLILLLGLILSSTILYISIDKIKSLHNQLTVLTNTKNSFLEVKINTERLLSSIDIEEANKVWIVSVENFDKALKRLDIEQRKKLDDLWYISKKEIEKIKKLLQEDIMQAHHLHQKSILMLKGELFALSQNKTDHFILINSLTRKIEYLVQYEKFIFNEFGRMDRVDKTNIDKQITTTIYYSILFTFIIISMMIVLIYIMNKKISKIELQLLTTQENLNTNILELNDMKVLLQNIIDSVPASIFWKDKNSVYLGANKHFLADANVPTQKNIIGKNDYEMPWGEKEAKNYIEDDNFVITSGKAKLNIEETQTQEDGSIIHVITSKVPLKNSKDKMIGILGIYIDVTEKKKIAEELTQKNRLLIQQSKMAAMGEMLENIAHQWRQPLSLILSSASGIKLKQEYDMLDNEFLLESIDNISKSVEHLNQTIEDFRNYFKQDKKPIFFSIEKTVDKALFLVQSKLKNRSIHIEKNMSQSLAFGLENEFIQVIMNIFNNSIDALEKVNVENRYLFIESKEIEVCGEEVDKELSTCKCIELKIYDNAGGIKEEIIDKIFDAYFTTKGEENGTGIGLFMSKEMIKKHMKGSISVTNKQFTFNNTEYKGALFTILITAEKY